MQEVGDKCGPSTDIFGEYMGTYGILKEVSDLEDRDVEEYIHFLSCEYLLSNSLHPLEVFFVPFLMLFVFLSRSSFGKKSIKAK